MLRLKRLELTPFGLYDARRNTWSWRSFQPIRGSIAAWRGPEIDFILGNEIVRPCPPRSVKFLEVLCLRRPGAGQEWATSSQN